MDSKKYFAELTRRLGQYGTQTGNIENDILTVKLDGYPVCGVNAAGDVYRRMGDMVGPKADELYQQTEEIASMVMSTEETPTLPLHKATSSTKAKAPKARAEFFLNSVQEWTWQCSGKRFLSVLP